MVDIWSLGVAVDFDTHDSRVIDEKTRFDAFLFLLVADDGGHSQPNNREL